jgi:hypothetical protein
MSIEIFSLVMVGKTQRVGVEGFSYKCRLQITLAHVHINLLPFRDAQHSTQIKPTSNDKSQEWIYGRSSGELPDIYACAPMSIPCPSICRHHAANERSGFVHPNENH